MSMLYFQLGTISPAIEQFKTPIIGGQKKYGEKEERDRVRQMSRHVAIGDFWCGAPDYSIILQVFNETRRESANAASALVSFRCV
jgi:hypothetical protein